MKTLQLWYYLLYYLKQVNWIVAYCNICLGFMLFINPIITMAKMGLILTILWSGFMLLNYFAFMVFSFTVLQINNVA